MREALATFRSKYEGAHWRTAEAESVLGACLAGLGRHEDAEHLLSESHETLRRLRGERAFITRQAHERLHAFYQQESDEANFPEPG